MPNNNNLGDYLRKLRGKESLREVSERINGGLSHSYISDLEKGVSRRGKPIKPSPEALKTLAEAYNVPYSKLMSLAGYADTETSTSKQKKTVTVESALDSIMTSDGKKLSEDDKRVAADIIKRLLEDGK